MQNYDFLIERISKSSKLEKKEIERRVEAKRAKLSGLISREGAAQIVAAELGVNLDNLTLKISELMAGMKKVNIIGKILDLFPVRNYEKNGRKGKIGSFVVADETGNARVVLWDTNHIGLIEEGKIKQGDAVEIRNAGMRDMEIHLSGFSELKKSDAVIENVRTEARLEFKRLNEIQQGQNVQTRGIVVQMFNPRFFYTCPECGKKVIESVDGFSCDEHGKVRGNERAILNFVIDDGNDTIRIVLFSEQINKVIPEEELKNVEKLSAFRNDFLGSEVCVSGIVKKNQLFNNLEINCQGIEKVDVEKLIEELEKGQTG